MTSPATETKQGLTSEQRRVALRLAEISGERGACTTWVARGCFARSTYSVLRRLVKRGLVADVKPPHGYWPEWRLTDAGRASVSKAEGR